MSKNIITEIMNSNENHWTRETEHLPTCRAVQWVKFGDAPFEWNVLNLSHVVVDQDCYEIYGNKPLMWEGYKMKCGDPNCTAVKIINSKVLGYFQNEHFKPLLK